MKRLIFIFLLGLVVLMTSSCKKDEKPTYTPFHVYSNMIERVEKVGMLTGVNAFDNTQEKWDIGGTDLGIPYYDDVREQMYFLFGDTNHEINFAGTENWRSQTVGISKDFDASDGIKFDSFISTDKKNGFATQIIDAMHDANDALGEITVIPTGGIAINGVHYVYYMSVRTWHQIGWDVNYCGVAKSIDGVNFEILDDLFWSEKTYLGQTNVTYLLNQDKQTIKNHQSSNFLQIYPYQIGEYVYIFGIPNARFGGVKLGRVLASEIEDFSKYEYYTGKDATNNPMWVKGQEGLEALEDNDASYIVEPQVGELNVYFNPYLAKYVMTFYSNDRIVLTCSENLFDWSPVEILVSSNDASLPYGAFTHEKYLEDNGKVTYFMMSQYYDKSLGDNGYNVIILKVTFK